MKQFLLFLIAFICPLMLNAQMGVPFDIDVLEYQNQNKAQKYKTDEEKLEFIQARYLKEMFLKYIFNSDISLLTEEEQADSVVPVSDMKLRNDMMVQVFAELLAKQDLLQLKRQYLSDPESVQLNINSDQNRTEPQFIYRPTIK